MSRALAFDSKRYDLRMDVFAIRLARLKQLQEEHGGEAKLARILRKSPSQISQWVHGRRKISEQSARNIERDTRRSHGWMDTQESPDELLVREPVSTSSQWPFLSISPQTYEEASHEQRGRIESFAAGVLSESAANKRKKKQ